MPATGMKPGLTRVSMMKPGVPNLFYMALAQGEDVPSNTPSL